MLIRVAGKSDRGTVRERNEDHYCLGPFVEQDALTALTLDTSSSFFQQYGLLAAVADGIGGYAGGAQASRIALETLSARFYSERRAGCTSEELANCLRRHLEEVQQVLAAQLARAPELADAGTTIAGIALMPPSALAVFHAGDSRVLRLAAGYLRALTVDHSPLGADIAAGRLTEEEASALPESHQITRSLGAHGDARAEVNGEFRWDPGITFLLCTDGFYGVGRGLPRQALRDALHDGAEAETLVHELLADAVATDGNDNATLVMVQLQDDGR